MRKVSDVVREIVLSSETELTALSRGVLNLSAYAKRILPEVERRSRKPVQLGSVVVALSRFAGTVELEDPLLPVIILESIAVKSGLSEIAFSKTSENKARAQVLYQNKDLAQADFLTITHGIGEISIFLPEILAAKVLRVFGNEKPRVMLHDLAALTVTFGEQYIQQSNVYFALLRHLAVKQINIVELISTFTELTFLVHQEDLNELFITMNALMRSRTARSKVSRKKR